MPLVTHSSKSLQSMAARKWGAKDEKSMSNNHRMTQKFIRAPLAAIALCCVAIAMTPQAIAQACGPSVTLSANQWTMVGIPCVPPAAKRNIGDVFGPSLGTSNYGVTWIAWKRVYDDAQCTVSTGPSDCYVKLTLASAATTGDAFWLYTTEQKTLQFSSTTASTPGPSFQFPAKVSSDGNSRYYMFANPYAATVSWANVVFPSTLTLWGVTIPYTLSVQQAIDTTVVSKNINYWNGNTYYTRDLNSPVATFTAKTSVWLEMLKPNSAITNISVSVLKP